SRPVIKCGRLNGHDPQVGARMPDQCCVSIDPPDKKTELWRCKKESDANADHGGKETSGLVQQHAFAQKRRFTKGLRYRQQTFTRSLETGRTPIPPLLDSD